MIPQRAPLLVFMIALIYLRWESQLSKIDRDNRPRTVQFEKYIISSSERDLQ